MSDDVIRPGEMNHHPHRGMMLGGPSDYLRKAMISQYQKYYGDNIHAHSKLQWKNDIVKHDYYNIGETEARVKEFVRRKFKWLPRPWLKVTNIIGNFVGHNFIRSWDASKGLDYTDPKNIKYVNLNKLNRRK